MNRDAAYLEDILDSARAAIGYLHGVSREQFQTMREKQDAVIRSLEVVGEAARRLSPATKDAAPEVPWRKLVDMRNVLIHQYDGVDLDIVYETVTEFLPTLIPVITSLRDRH